MNKMETTKILTVIYVAFPRCEVTDKTKMELMVEVWQESFEDIPFKTVETAVQKLLYELKFPPTIADVAQRIAEVNNPNILTAAEAWGEVTKAERLYGYYNQQQAMDSLSPLTRTVVEQIGFINWCVDKDIDTENTLRAQFRMAYTSMAERQKNDALLPERLKNIIAQNKILFDGNTEQKKIEDG